MTAAQGFLHASLTAHGDLARAITSLNEFIQPRCPPDTFVTLWTGIFDPRRMSLDYVDAGHGYAMLLKADASIQMLDENGGIPIGVDPTFTFQTATAAAPPRGRVLVFSDGLVEQTANGVSPDSPRREFGKVGVYAAIDGCDGDNLLEHLFQELGTFAGGTGYTDDVTGVLVQWDDKPGLPENSPH